MYLGHKMQRKNILIVIDWKSNNGHIDYTIIIENMVHNANNGQFLSVISPLRYVNTCKQLLINKEC